MDIKQQLKEYGLTMVTASEALAQNDRVDFEHLWMILDSPLYVKIDAGVGAIKASHHVIRQLLDDTWLIWKENDGGEWCGTLSTSEMEDYSLVRLDRLPEALLDPWLVHVKTMMSDDEVVALKKELESMERFVEDPPRWCRESGPAMFEARKRVAEIRALLEAAWDGLTTPLYFTESGNLIREWQGRWLLLRTCDGSAVPDDFRIWVASHPLGDLRVWPIKYWGNWRDANKGDSVAQPELAQNAQPDNKNSPEVSPVAPQQAGFDNVDLDELKGELADHATDRIR